MRAFYFANPGLGVDGGRRVVGELSVDAGSYVVFAKADVGTNVARDTRRRLHRTVAAFYRCNSPATTTTRTSRSNRRVATTSKQPRSSSLPRRRVRTTYVSNSSIPIRFASA
jgi:hypothetical protein